MDEIVYFYPENHELHFEPGHPERPERVFAIRDALRNSDLWNLYPKLPPINLTDQIIQSIHSPEYLHVLDLTCKRAGHLDSDTYTTPSTWELAHRASGGAAAVAAAVWEGKSKRGFALTRPPGHHAMRGQGMGFCLLNNVSIAAEYLLQNYSISKIAIIDLDLHHGNGTQDIFWRRNDVLFISTHQAPFYPGTGFMEDTGAGAGEGWTANFPLPAGSGDKALLTIIDECILPLLFRVNPDIILVSYGFDAHWLDPLGQLLLTADGLAQCMMKVCTWADNYCKGKVVLVLEGGYDLNSAAACTNTVVAAMLGKMWIDPFPCPYPQTDRWRDSLEKARKIWNL